MSGLLVLIVIIAAVSAFAALAARYGVDSRDGSTDPRRPGYPVGIS